MKNNTDVVFEGGNSVKRNSSWRRCADREATLIEDNEILVLKMLKTTTRPFQYKKTGGDQIKMKLNKINRETNLRETIR